MLNIKKILLVTTLALSLPTIANASVEQDIRNLKSRLNTVEQDLIRYNEIIIPYQTALTVEPQVVLEDFNYYRDSNNKLQFDYKVVNKSDYLIYYSDIRLKITSTEVPDKVMSVPNTGSNTGIEPHTSYTMPARSLAVTAFKNASVGSMRTEHDLTGIRVVVNGKEYIVKEGDVTNANRSLSSYLKFIKEDLAEKTDLEKRIIELEATLP